ncbi:uncharacterized protein LOC9629062 [Selaginella moellendorffii]|uniref:uncharacterized protein LOC9629062 n=1 Tax=Selaginella moellendorffii TaxID=88036 RepID=UPI000D1C9B20|nr:uncharacterized protein LOC9629062 [Selaginella moellendorffii]|eukprot:XP_002975202.2 uncharacterized protein LOC9629062 [Selaginella moellendorffii]
MSRKVAIALLFSAFFGLAAASGYRQDDHEDARHGKHGSDRSKGDRDAPRRVSKMLDSYNLPQGMFPLPLVTDFSLDEEDGSFEMRLSRSCYAKLEEELLWYGEEIKGKVRSSRIEDLSGVQARELLVWLAVKGLHVDDPETGFVYLEIGLTYSRLSAQSFQEPPPCSDEASSSFIR